LFLLLFGSFDLIWHCDDPIGLYVWSFLLWHGYLSSSLPQDGT
jgi:hypothetical protein